MIINSTQYFRLSFNEANILMENYKGLNKTNLIMRLQELSKSVSDEILKQSAVSLLQKIANLSDDEFKDVYTKAEQGRLVYPPNFTLDN